MRILVVDDNRDVHASFRKILRYGQPVPDALEEAENRLLGVTSKPIQPLVFELHDAFQGKEGLELVQKAQQCGQPYTLVFLDVRMPPGWDGIETAARLWEVDPQLQIVICTAYADYSWDELVAQLGLSDRWVILKKPFEVVEVLQLASALNEKWRLQQELRQRLGQLETMVEERTCVLRQTNERLQQEMAAHQVATEALKENEEKLRKLTTSAQDGIVMIDAEGRISLWNAGATRVFGYTPEEAIGRNLHALLAPIRFHQAHREAFAQFQGTGQGEALGRTVELQALRKDGTEFPIELSLSAVLIKDRWHALGIVRDISQRKTAEAERERLIAELKAALANIQTLRGLLPICALCKKIRDDKGYWNQVEHYVTEHSDAKFTHSLCPECSRQLYPELQEEPATRQP